MVRKLMELREKRTNTSSGDCISLDNTFRSAKKATVAENKKTRVNLMKGGLLSVINERNEILAWVRTSINTITMWGTWS
jgi:hypothetical protein